MKNLFAYRGCRITCRIPVLVERWQKVPDTMAAGAMRSRRFPCVRSWKTDNNASAVALLAACTQNLHQSVKDNGSSKASHESQMKSGIF